MTRTDEAAATRVTSRDGTEISYFTTGDGPPLVVVHGTTADHTRWSPLLPHLEPHVTVHAVDRRGRGASGDAPEYQLQREFEDVAAVVDAVAEESGSLVHLYGHSYGGACALGAATLTSNLGKLVLYEPPLFSDAEIAPPTTRERLVALLDAGEPEAALELFLREVARMDEATLRVYRAQPAWERRVAAVHTVPREFDVDFEDVLRRERLAGIEVPTLLLQGSDSPPFMAAAATEVLVASIPDTRVVVLAGQAHAADVLIPEVFAGHVTGFLHDQG